MRQARQAKRAERAGGVSGGLAGRQRRRSLITSAAQKLQSSNNIYSRHSLTQRPRFMVHKKIGKPSCIYGPKENPKSIKEANIILQNFSLNNKVNVKLY